MHFFFVLLFSILIFSNLVIFFFFSKAFSLGITGKIVFGFILLFLGFSFFLNRILSNHFGDNIFLKIFNYISSFWLGMLACLLLFVILSSIILLICRGFSISINLKYLGIFTIILTLLYVSYGVWNANNPIIKTKQVEISNVPEVWKNKKIIFFSDLHIGKIIGKNFVDKVIDMINKENPDIIFIAGDLFDGQDAKGATYFKDSINKLKFSDGIFLVEGNHDTYFGEDNVYDMLEGTNITLLKNEFTNVDGLQIIGLDYSTNRDKTLSDLNALTSKGYDKNLPSILIFHEPILTEEFKNFGINLQLSGHTHNGQIWPFNYIVRIIFKGKEYGLFKEGDYNIYTTNGVGTWGPPMRMFNIPEVVVLKFN